MPFVEAQFNIISTSNTTYKTGKNVSNFWVIAVHRKLNWHVQMKVAERRMKTVNNSQAWDEFTGKMGSISLFPVHF